MQVIDAGISRWLPQVQQAACEYVVWVLQHASAPTMAALAGPALHGTVAALHKLPSGPSAAHLPLRGFLYQAVGQLAQVRSALCAACCVLRAWNEVIWLGLVWQPD